MRGGTSLSEHIMIRSYTSLVSQSAELGPVSTDPLAFMINSASRASIGSMMEYVMLSGRISSMSRQTNSAISIPGGEFSRIDILSCTNRISTGACSLMSNK